MAILALGCLLPRAREFMRLGMPLYSLLQDTNIYSLRSSPKPTKIQALEMSSLVTRKLKADGPFGYNQDLIEIPR